MAITKQRLDALIDRARVLYYSDDGNKVRSVIEEIGTDFSLIRGTIETLAEEDSDTFQDMEASFNEPDTLIRVVPDSTQH